MRITDAGRPATETLLPAAAARRAPRPRAADRPPWMEEPPLLVTLAKALFLGAIAVLMLFPFIYVVAVSFSSYKDVVSGGLILFPANPTLDAYRAVFAGGIVTRALTVSAGLAVFGTAARMLATISLAYGLSKPEVPGSRFVLMLVLGTLLFSPGMIPNYLLVKELGLLNTYQSLILPGLIGAFNLIILRNFFMNIPQELLDAARVDGASDWNVLWKIVLPLSKAVLAVIALFYGVAIWNSFFTAILYMEDASKWPIQVVLRQYVLQGTPLTMGTDISGNQPPPPTQTIQMAIVVIATAPILLVYPFLQRYFVKGVLTGAIKG